MGIRIQPRDIEVPKDDPFRHDLLDRKVSVEVLTQLLSNFDGPCVLAVDAAWGNGKTTFFRIWRQHLLNLGFPVVQFNAWETDFSGDPFLALSTELTDGLKEYADSDDKIDAKINATRELAKKVMRRAVPGIIRAVTAGILDVNPLLEKELGGALASIAEDRFSEYKSAKDSITEFRSTLQDVADTLAKRRNNRPLIVMIDELDRCRPSYAVELLEVAKHFFSVNHIVFVLAVNRSELTHSIQALYGNDFDASGYLHRFIDIDFRLPDPDRDTFITAALYTTGIRDYFKRNADRGSHDGPRVMNRLLQVFFHTPDLSLRQIAQAIHRLGLVFASLRSDQRSFATTAVIALVFRTIDRSLYRRFCRLEVSDLDVVQEIFGRLGAASPPKDSERALFEATITAGWYELRKRQLPVEFNAVTDSPLIRKYLSLGANRAKETTDNEDLRHANLVIQLISEKSVASIGDGGGDFLFSVRRIELLSESLVNKTAQV